MEGVSVDVDMSPPIFSHQMEGDVRIVVDACMWCGGTRSIDREMCGWTHRSSAANAMNRSAEVDRCVEESGEWKMRGSSNIQHDK